MVMGLSLVAVFSLAIPACGAELCVAKDGRDTWSGRLAAPNKDKSDGPFATLEAARDAMRALKRAGELPEGGVTVWVRGGEYPRADTFSLAAEDSGTAQCPIVYRGYPQEEARFVGGRRIGGFAPVTDSAILARLHEAARDNVVQVDLPAEGVTNLGRLTPRGFGRPLAPSHLQLFFQGKAMTLARWPNDGFAQMVAIPEGAAFDDGHGGALGKLEAGFHYEGDRPRQWAKSDDIWVHGYWAWDWANSYENIEAVDLERRLIKTRPPYGSYGFRAGQRFYFLNVLEELDSRGEYYLDHETGILYFWPPEPLEDAEVYVSTLEQPFVSMSGASYITLRDLTFEYSRGSGIVLKGGERNVAGGCAIRNVGNWAVTVEGGAEHGVVGCDVAYTGDGGIALHGGDRRTLSPAGHRAINNHIHHMGEWTRCYRPGISISGVGNRVAHNLIHDGPHSAIQLGGNEHVIEFNEIHSVCLETGDVGAFYMGRDWTQRGNIIRHNFFHHTGGVGMGSMAVYLDDCASGTTVFGNVFYKTSRAAFIGGGRDNVVENNIFVECTPAVWIDGRGLDGSPVWHGMVYDTMKERLEAMNWQEPPYGERYPELAELEAYYARDGGVPPEGNAVVRNIAVGGTWLQIHWHAKEEMVEIRDNLVDENPRFVDPDNMNFRLKGDSPAYGLGFQRIPFGDIGLCADEYRRAVPN